MPMISAIGIVGLVAVVLPFDRFAWLNPFAAGIRACLFLLVIAKLIAVGVEPIDIPILLVSLALLVRPLQRWRYGSDSLSVPRTLKPHSCWKSWRRRLGLFGGRILAASLFVGIVISWLGDQSSNYSALPWDIAFQRMHQELEAKYAFGKWKQVAWSEKYKKYSPRIAKAVQLRDLDQYSAVIREYVFEIPDGHLSIESTTAVGAGDLPANKHAAVGGGVGVAAVELSDGRLIARVVLPEGPASLAGMDWGAELLSWNGRPAIDAALDSQVCWIGNSPRATAEGQRLRRIDAFTRAPVGTKVTIEFRNPDSEQLHVAQLMAVDDAYESLFQSHAETPFDGSWLWGLQWPVFGRTLPKTNLGYIKILAELPSMMDWSPSQSVKDLVTQFDQQNVDGLIIDVRGNLGGDDYMVAEMLTPFFGRREFYETITYFDLESKDFEVVDQVWIEPSAQPFRRPVVCLIDIQTVSSGEGIALGVQRLANGRVMGFHGTNGSFGMTGGEIRMPGGISVSYPLGQSLDVDGRIQVDSDATLTGGVQPDVRVPVTEAAMRAIYVEGRDYLLERAIAELKQD